MGRLEGWKMDMMKLRGRTGKLCGSGMAKAVLQGQADNFVWMGLPLSFIQQILTEHLQYANLL